MRALVLLPHASPLFTAASADDDETTQLIIMPVCLAKDERVAHSCLLYGQLVAVIWTSTRPFAALSTFRVKSNHHIRYKWDVFIELYSDCFVELVDAKQKYLIKYKTNRFRLSQELRQL
ncbi:hypothetical protein EGR_06682 [Echinococcus granulosus]|uniref:Uncharacterized protein n=1 Tax=Echinococcus granulosus TaxID=6210 RepID=W6UCQ3_ECHGR|nr:hypothetical protein EGR_06682 [Echinococcus granulosus]EUB58501.1 hypothetical protein EGR_06682 [Echinococcus granulosus]